MSLANYSSPYFGGGGLSAALPPPVQPPPPPEPYPPVYTRITAGSPGGRSTIHAVLDYDDDFQSEEEADDISHQFQDESKRRSHGGYQQRYHHHQQGPIVVRNESVAVVPLYSFGTTINNGSLVHIPVLWSALSIALGLEIRGDVIRGTPCIKKHHQLFCPTAGSTYPLERIEVFIDENKALMKRMYGEFELSTEYGPPGQEVYESDRGKRQNHENRNYQLDEKGSPPNGYSYRYPGPREKRQAFPGNTTEDNGRVDACQSKVEIVTPYWAANSAGKIRAIVNTQHFEQAIHQEVCSKVRTNRCANDCGCEQKYKWHRLLAYDPDNDCKGIFMDWFLFPSCCVCRCAPPFEQQQSPASQQQPPQQQKRTMQPSPSNRRRS